MEITSGRKTGVVMMNIFSGGKKIRNVTWHEFVIDIMH